MYLAQVGPRSHLAAVVAASWAAVVADADSMPLIGSKPDTGSKALWGIVLEVARRRDMDCIHVVVLMAPRRIEGW